MKNMKDLELYHKYPQILAFGFINPDEITDPKYWLEPISCYGIQCDYGWYAIIDKTLLKIHKLCKQENALDKVRIVQIKEKFGGLRIHYEFLGVINDNCKEMIAKHIRDAEIEASKTCEQCGNPGKLVRKDWIETLCWKCRIKDFFGHINIFK